MLVRPEIQVLAALIAESLAVLSAERREWGREVKLLEQERRQVDLEVRSDRLRVRGSLAQRLARHHAEPREVLLRELRVHRRFDGDEAATALRLQGRVGHALEVRARVRVGRDDVRLDRQGTSLQETR